MPVAFEDLPTVGLETPARVVAHRKRRLALDRDVVGIVDCDESAERERTSERARFVRNALLKVAVAAENPCAVRARLHLRGESETNAHCEALPERARRNLNAANELALGVTRRARTELAEVLEFVEQKRVRAGEMKERIDKRTAMPTGKHKAVAVSPFRMRRRKIQILEPERRSNVRLSHRAAGMTRLRFFHHIRDKNANRVRRQFQFRVFVFHGGYSTTLPPVPPSPKRGIFRR